MPGTKIDMVSKLKWAVKVFLSENSKRGVFDVNNLAKDVVDHAKYGTAFNSQEIITTVAYKVTVAYFRHRWTNYDEILRRGGKSSEYREMANRKVQIQIRQWKKGKKGLKVKDIRVQQ